MTPKLTTSVLHLLLAVLLSTFMSPSFAWEMIDSHSDEIHLMASGDLDQHEDVAAHHHHHHESEGDSAHSQIGHLLSHLPGMIDQTLLTPTVIATSGGIPAGDYSLIEVETAPPYKPPRNFLFV
ncbi:MAG: hypothetical protein Q8O24_07920 [Gallionellaceae bacterium]|nr:hypothetical protein [Gallionellaceae bacterium]